MPEGLPDVLEAAAARERLGALWLGSSVEAAEELQRSVTWKAINFTLIDRIFKIEVGMFNVISRTDDKNRLVTTIMDMMPSAAHETTPTAVAVKLKALEQSALYRLSNEAAQAQLKLAAGVIHALATEQQPDVRARAKDVWMQGFLSRCGWFVTRKMPGKDGAVLVGAVAVADMMASGDAKVKKSQAALADPLFESVDVLAGTSQDEGVRRADQEH